MASGGRGRLATVSVVGNASEATRAARLELVCVREHRQQGGVPMAVPSALRLASGLPSKFDKTEDVMEVLACRFVGFEGWKKREYKLDLCSKALPGIHRLAWDDPESD